MTNFYLKFRSLLLLKAVLVSLFTISISSESFASHAAGADLTYRWLSGNTYEVTAAFYRDCGGIAQPNTVSLEYSSDNCNYSNSINLPLVNNGPVITYPCSSTLTICQGGSAPGIQQWLYRANITLPFVCTDWLLSYEVVARNCAITTIVQPSPCNSSTSYEPIYVEALLNNLDAPGNSSPSFSNVPISFICLGQDFNYNHGVLDVDADSLAYSLITPLTSSNTTITYLPGYSATSPINSTPAFTINSITGDLFMHSTSLQVSVVAVKVNEYRNGVLIGSVIRDMQIYSRNCSPNVVPAASGINGTNNFTAYVCPGSNLCFDIFSSDANQGDEVTMNWNSGTPGATFNISGSPYPTGQFCWTPLPSDARDQPYTFTVTVRDDACPLNGLQTYSYQVFVPNVGADIVSSDFSGYGVSCIGDVNGSLTANPTGGISPFTYLWSTLETTETINGLGAGAYTVTITDSKGCVGTESGVITEPDQLIASISESVNPSCGQNNGSATASSVGGAGGNEYLWSDNQTTQTAIGLAPGTYTVTVTDDNGCSSESSVVLQNEGLPFYTEVSVSICEGSSHELPDGSSVSQAGSYPVTLQTSLGCDSTIVTLLNTNAVITDEVNVSICEGDSYLLPDGQTVSLEGQYISELTTLAGCDSIITTNISFHVTAAPIVNASGPLAFCPGGSVTLTSSAAASYQWLKNGAIINGATSQSYTVTTSGNYKVKISTACGDRTSSSNLVVKHPLPIVSVSPSGLVKICSYDNLLMTATVAGNDPVSYQWYRNNVAIQGATNSTYTATLNGNYRVLVTNSVTGCEKLSAKTTVSKINFNAVLTHDNPLITCDVDITFTLTSNAGPGATYIWKRNNVVLQNVTGLSYTTKIAGTYKVLVTDEYGCTKHSNSFTVIIDCKKDEDKREMHIEPGYTLYPNPANGTVYVERTNGIISNDVHVELYDISGRVILTIDNSKTEAQSVMQFDTDKLSRGIYFLRINENGYINTQKVVVE